MDRDNNTAQQAVGTRCDLYRTANFLVVTSLPVSSTKANVKNCCTELFRFVARYVHSSVAQKTETFVPTILYSTSWFGNVVIQA